MDPLPPKSVVHITTASGRRLRFGQVSREEYERWLSQGFARREDVWISLAGAETDYQPPRPAPTTG